MLYNRFTGIYKFENNTYPRRIRRRWNLGHIFQGKSASYGPGSMVHIMFAVVHMPLYMSYACYCKWDHNMSCVCCFK